MKLITRHFVSKEMDKLAYLFIGFGTLIVLPQVFQIYTTRSANDLNLFTYLGFTTGDFFWLIYGIEKKIHTITLSALLKLIINGSILYGIHLYGG